MCQPIKLFICIQHTDIQNVCISHIILLSRFTIVYTGHISNFVGVFSELVSVSTGCIFFHFAVPVVIFLLFWFSYSLTLSLRVSVSLFLSLASFFLPFFFSRVNNNWYELQSWMLLLTFALRLTFYLLSSYTQLYTYESQLSYHIVL